MYGSKVGKVRSGQHARKIVYLLISLGPGLPPSPLSAALATFLSNTRQYTRLEILANQYPAAVQIGPPGIIMLNPVIANAQATILNQPFWISICRVPK